MIRGHAHIRQKKEITTSQHMRLCKPDQINIDKGRSAEKRE